MDIDKLIKSIQDVAGQFDDLITGMEKGVGQILKLFPLRFDMDFVITGYDEIIRAVQDLGVLPEDMTTRLDFTQSGLSEIMDQLTALKNMLGEELFSGADASLDVIIGKIESLMATLNTAKASESKSLMEEALKPFKDLVPDAAKGVSKDIVEVITDGVKDGLAKEFLGTGYDEIKKLLTTQLASAVSAFGPLGIVLGVTLAVTGVVVKNMADNHDAKNKQNLQNQMKEYLYPEWMKNLEVNGSNKMAMEQHLNNLDAFLGEYENIYQKYLNGDFLPDEFGRVLNRATEEMNLNMGIIKKQLAEGLDLSDEDLAKLDFSYLFTPEMFQFEQHDLIVEYVSRFIEDLNRTIDEAYVGDGFASALKRAAEEICGGGESIDNEALSNLKNGMAEYTDCLSNAIAAYEEFRQTHQVNSDDISLVDIVGDTSELEAQFEAIGEMFIELFEGLEEADFDTLSIFEKLKDEGVDAVEVITENMDSFLELLEQIDAIEFHNMHTAFEEAATPEGLANLRLELENTIDSMDRLSGVYEKLARGEELSAENIRELTKLYPNIAKHIAENVDWRETLTDVIYDEMAVDKENTVSALKNIRDRIEKEIEKLNVILNDLDTEKISFDEAYDQMENRLTAYKDFYDKTMEAIAKEIPGPVEATASLRLKSDETVRDMITSRLTQLYQQLDIFNNAIEKADNEPITRPAPSRSFGGGSGSGSVRAAAQEIEEEKNLFEEAWKDYQKLVREGQLEALGDKKAYLDKMLEQHQDYGQCLDQVLKELAEIESQIGMVDVAEKIQKVEDSMERLETAADFQVLVDELDKLLKTYIEDSDEYNAVLKRMGEAQAELTKKVEEELQARLDATRKLLDETIQEELKHIERFKAMDGLRYGPGDEDIYRFDITTEIRSYNAIIDRISQDIDVLMSKGDQITAAEQKMLDELVAMREKYYDKVDSLHIQHLKNRQKEYEQALKAEEAAHKTQLKNLEAHYKELSNVVKERYKEQVDAAQAAADAQIASLQRQISEIDKLLNRQEIQEKDDDYNRKRTQLEQMIKYETDESNIYELNKELDRLNTDYEKRKQREALQAQKEALNERISAIRTSLEQEKALYEQARDDELRALEERMDTERNVLSRDFEKRKVRLQEEFEDYTLHVQEILEMTDGMIDTKEECYERDKASALESLDDQYEGHEDFARDTQILAEDSASKRVTLATNTVNDIIEMLLNKVAEFAEAGRRAGQAYSEAFNAAARSALSHIGGSSFASSAYNMGMAAGTSNNTINFSQTITAPVATPSVVAAETKRGLEDALRYV